jgi:homoserine O-succinyltransferase/O-acetyltransferase
MPLIVDGPVPTRWSMGGNSRAVDSSNSSQGAGLSVAFINNMPDAALEDTELQFFSLLDIASESIPIHVNLYSLPGVPRTERGLNHLRSFYNTFEGIWQNKFDGVIVTGTEPHQPDLRDEPYWGVLGDVFDWAERSTSSAVLSCLAAHAGVLHSDGVSRHRLPDKQFGVFESGKTCDHVLMNNTPERVHFPHSRWNEVREEELTSAGYIVLAKSAAGVDAFVKKKGKSLFVHFQGHPEYDANTLFKEYRRDIKRFLNRERETYPSMPQGYFDTSAARLLDGFRESAVAHRREEVMTSFPEEAIVGSLRNGWYLTSACMYRNWVQYLGSRETEELPFAATARTGRRIRPKLAISGQCNEQKRFHGSSY